ncbi:hemolysin family protein [Zhihengliuella somnathii]
MIVVGLAVLAAVCIVCAALLTAAESAFFFLPRQEAEQMLARKARPRLRAILADPAPHTHAVRFWRIWFEMASAVALGILYHDVLDHLFFAGLLATASMAAIGFVLVGISPRRLGQAHAATVVALAAPFVRFLRLVLGPIPSWLVRLGSRLSPGDAADEEAFFTEEQFREFVDRANEADVLEDVEADLIHSVFELGDTRVRAVMVPRTDMVTVDAGTGLRDAMSLFLRSGYSRIPVIEDSADRIVGVVYLKDLAAALHLSERDDRPVEALARDVRYVPDSKGVAELLQELQRESTHVAIVIDEYGGTAGLVTLEDLIEEIVGEIDDEYDADRLEPDEVEPGIYRVDARMPIDDLGELFGLDLEDDEVETVGGLLAKSLGRVPIVGSEVSVHGLNLHAEDLEGRRNRIRHVLAWVAADEATDPGDERSHDGSRGRRTADDISEETA